MPEQCIDPVVTAAQIVMGIQNIKSRRISAYDTAVLSVCKIHGGDAYNIIPETVDIEGSVRTFSKELRDSLPGMLEQIAGGIAAGNGAQAEVIYERGYGSVINDEKLTDGVRAAAAEWFGKDSVMEIQPVMPGEDFSAFTEATGCPGCFVEIGTRNHEKGTDKPHHNPKYMMDEDGLYYGAGLFAAILEHRLMK